jgi:hypothetical protein
MAPAAGTACTTHIARLAAAVDGLKYALELLKVLVAAEELHERVQTAAAARASYAAQPLQVLQ